MRIARRLAPWWLAALSALLLVLSYPPFDWGWLAWVALVPLCFAIDGQSPRRAFAIAYVVGFLYFLGLASWIIYVTVVGWILLVVYLALFVGVFGWFVSRIQRLTLTAQLLLIPSAWVALEWARSHLLTGFGWGLLGYTQWRWLPIIQIADVTGAYGVSWVVVLVNVAWWLALRARRRSSSVRLVPVVIAAVLVPVWGYGLWRLQAPIDGQRLTIAVVQGSIPQSQKWDERLRDDIIARYDRLTRVAAQQHPALIVWPETSVPGLLGADDDVTGPVVALARAIRTPLLVGAPTERVQGGSVRLYNSAILVTPDGGLEQRYDKLHLVPYGEFLPFERYVPWLRHVLPPMGDFAPGREATVFRVEGQGTRGKGQVVDGAVRFSVLICFEDVFPSLARRFAREGAGLLLVITNDAWFGPTGAAAQHAQASVFRAVENRVSVARAANTGLSCFIDPWGRLTHRVQEATGRALFVSGVSVEPVLVTVGARSVYRVVGDGFAVGCACFALGVLLLRSRRR